MFKLKLPWRDIRANFLRFHMLKRKLVLLSVRVFINLFFLFLRSFYFLTFRLSFRINPINCLNKDAEELHTIMILNRIKLGFKLITITQTFTIRNKVRWKRFVQRHYVYDISYEWPGDSLFNKQVNITLVVYIDCALQSKL